MVMLFKFVDMDKIPIKYEREKVICFCGFCKGKSQKAYVRHLKLFDKNEKEYYLNINEKSNQIEIKEKF